MNCPACGNVLTLMTAGGVTVDACERGCGGMWLDALEIKKFDEPHESAGEALLNIPRDPDIQVDVSQKRTCPKCDGVVMMQHFFSVKKKVTVDECPQCAGVWLDAGELAGIRELFSSEEERRQAAREYMDEVFGPELEQRREENEEKLKKARRFGHMFRFLCPSYYLPGKQKWGAH